MQLKSFLLIYIIVFFALVFVARTLLVWKRTGKNAFVLMQQPGALGIIARYFRLLPALSVFVVVIFALFPALYPHLAPFYWLQSGLLRTVGVTLLIVSLIWIMIAQSVMGNSWRIGIDEDSRTQLVRNGPFRLSRNPVFLGIIANVIGFFLVLPNALTLVILVLDIALIQIQVALEEEHLAQQHGDAYLAYCGEVRRWL